jgi:hypothetical protein
MGPWFGGETVLDPMNTNQLHSLRYLFARLHEEPVWVDLSWARGIENASARPQFQQVVIQLAAAILEVPFDELFARETERQRARTRRLAVSIVAIIVALAFFSVFAFFSTVGCTSSCQNGVKPRRVSFLYIAA